MVLRVVAGTAGGRRLATLSGESTRPTSQRVREAVFNSLGSRQAIARARVLDLYAGSGALGIEALSRGAASSTFVDINRAAVDILRSNLASLQMTERAEVIVADARAALDELKRRGERFDLALIDPPYGFDDWPALLSELPAALIVAESDRPVDVGDGFVVYHQRRHGATVVTFATAADGGPNPSGAQH